MTAPPDDARAAVASETAATAAGARPAAVVVEGLARRFGDVEAVRGIDLQVAAGEILPIVMPRAPARRRRPWSMPCR